MSLWISWLVSNSQHTFISCPIRASYRSSAIGPRTATASCSSPTQHWHPGCSRVLQWQDVRSSIIILKWINWAEKCIFFFFVHVFPRLHPLLLLFPHRSFFLCPVSTPTMFTWLALVARATQASRASTSIQSTRT